jgi:hypothetical protein
MMAIAAMAAITTMAVVVFMICSTSGLAERRPMVGNENKGLGENGDDPKRREAQKLQICRNVGRGILLAPSRGKGPDLRLVQAASYKR